MTKLGLVAVAAAVGGALLTAAGCSQRPRMCSAPTECGPTSGCVAGRCLPDGGTPAINSARRLLATPVDVAFVRRGDAPSQGELPTLFTLGRDGDGDAALFLRFSVPLAKDANVIEAYLLLERTETLDADPAPITLHAARIIDPWDGASLSWARQPRVEETRSPSTLVAPTGRTLVRLDVRELVSRWRQHDRRDQGIVVVADTSSTTGMAFALTASGEAPAIAAEPSSSSTPLWGASAGGASASEPRAASAGLPRAGPRLELYLK